MAVRVKNRDRAAAPGITPTLGRCVVMVSPPDWDCSVDSSATKVLQDGFRLFDFSMNQRFFRHEA